MTSNTQTVLEGNPIQSPEVLAQVRLSVARISDTEAVLTASGSFAAATPSQRGARVYLVAPLAQMTDALATLSDNSLATPRPSKLTSADTFAGTFRLNGLPVPVLRLVFDLNHVEGDAISGQARLALPPGNLLSAIGSEGEVWYGSDNNANLLTRTGTWELVAPPAVQPVDRPPAGAEEFSFNGNNFVEFELSRDAHTELTIEFWAKRGARAEGIVLFHSGFNRQYPGVRATGDVQWVAGGGSKYPNGLTATNAKLEQDRWTHLTFVKNATANRMMIYVDGVAVVDRQGGYGDRDRMTDPTEIGIFRLGHSVPPQKNGWSPDWMKKHGFEGQMAEVRIWKVVRTPEQIQAGMRVVTAQLPDKTGLLVYGPIKGQLAKPA